LFLFPLGSFYYRTRRKVAFSYDQSSLNAAGYLYHRPHKKLLQKNDDQQDDQRRKVHRQRVSGNDSAYRRQQRLGHTVQKDNDFVVGVGIHPGDHGARDNNPHIHGKYYIDDFCNGNNQIAGGDIQHNKNSFAAAVNKEAQRFQPQNRAAPY